MRTEFLCISVLRVASGPRVKLAVVLMLFLLFVALCSFVFSAPLSVIYIYIDIYI